MRIEQKMQKTQTHEKSGKWQESKVNNFPKMLKNARDITSWVTHHMKPVLNKMLQTNLKTVSR